MTYRELINVLASYSAELLDMPARVELDNGTFDTIEHVELWSTSTKQVLMMSVTE